MDFKGYVQNVGYEAQLKQELASIAGFGNHNLTDYTVSQLVHEVERQGKDYLFSGEQLVMHPTVQDAYLFINFGSEVIKK